MRTSIGFKYLNASMRAVSLLLCVTSSNVSCYARLKGQMLISTDCIRFHYRLKCFNATETHKWGQKLEANEGGKKENSHAYVKSITCGVCVCMLIDKCTQTANICIYIHLVVAYRAAAAQHKQPCIIHDVIYRVYSTSIEIRC